MSAFLVTGAVGVGKTTLLRRVIDACVSDREIYGFRTEKVSPAENAGETGKVFIYPATSPPDRDTAHCVAEILEGGSCVPHTEIFETLGAALLSDIPSGAIVMMDELGFLEKAAPKFCEKVLEVISGDFLILGAIKPLSTPFLDAVRKHPAVTLFEITELNRDEVSDEMMLAFSAKLSLNDQNFGEI